MKAVDAKAEHLAGREIKALCIFIAATVELGAT